MATAFIESGIGVVGYAVGAVAANNGLVEGEHRVFLPSEDARIFLMSVSSPNAEKGALLADLFDDLLSVHIFDSLFCLRLEFGSLEFFGVFGYVVSWSITS